MASRSGCRKRVFISFDYDHDRNYRFLLSALKENPRSPIDFDDLTPGQVKTTNPSRVKAVLTTHIRRATDTLVIIGPNINAEHPDSAHIGTRNWQWWEIEKSKAEGKGLIAVKIEPAYPTPDPLVDADATWVLSFEVDAILKALNGGEGGPE
jgi:hypothetical protein